MASSPPRRPEDEEEEQEERRHDDGDDQITAPLRKDLPKLAACLFNRFHTCVLLQSCRLADFVTDMI